MKFKYVFWIFNAIVLFALIIFATASIFLFGRDYAAAYWKDTWIIVAVFVVLVGILDFYFAGNWRLFALLEKEDWPSLLTWLEGRIYGKGRLRKPYANLLINTALSVSNLEAVKKLESTIRQNRPDMIRALGVSLGIPVLLDQDSEAIVSFFAPLADDGKTHRRDWAQWCRSSSTGREGIPELLELLDGKDSSIALLSLQVLDRFTAGLADDQNAKIEESRNSLRQSLAGAPGDKALGRSREEHLMAVVLTSRINQAREELLEDKDR